MKLTGFDVFDSTIQRSNLWLKDLMQELNWSDQRKTYLAFRSVLHLVRDHLPVRDAIYFGRHMPMLIRGIYFELWDPAATPLPIQNRTDFLSALSNRLSREDDGNHDAEVIARAVFRLLQRKVSEGEIEDLQHLLPGTVLDLWPQTLRAA